MSKLTYKNRPIIRKDNLIYYGSMADTNITMIQLLTKKEAFGITISDKVIVQLQLTDETSSLKDRIIKVSEKHSLFEALDIADIWLTRALK